MTRKNIIEPPLGERIEIDSNLHLMMYLYHYFEKINLGDREDTECHGSCLVTVGISEFTANAVDLEIEDCGLPFNDTLKLNFYSLGHIGCIVTCMVDSEMFLDNGVWIRLDLRPNDNEIELSVGYEESLLLHVAPINNHMSS